MTIRFEHIKPKIGSRVFWDDRKDLFTEESASLIRSKIEERTVLVFPKLNLTDSEQLQITNLIGQCQNISSNTTTTKNQDICKITLDKKINFKSEYSLATFFWHIEGLMVETAPSLALLLSCRQPSPTGGQTEFASTYAAYEGLSEEEKKAIEGLKVVHTVKANLAPIAEAISESEYDAVTKNGLVKEYPIVWTHQSGRKSMVIGTTADHIVGQTIPAGRALLVRLHEWAAQPEFSMRHEWEEGDFVVWDNTGTIHRVLPYEETSGRMMHRTSIAGTETVK